jgi:hypothetical protein
MSSRHEIPRAYTRKLALERSRVSPYPILCCILVTHSRPDFTGISAPYEAPEKPEIHIKTDESDVTESVRIITQYLSEKGYI